MRAYSAVTEPLVPLRLNRGDEAQLGLTLNRSYARRLDLCRAFFTVPWARAGHPPFPWARPRLLPHTLLPRYCIYGPDPGALETEAPTSQASYTISSSEPTPRAPMIYPGLRAQPHTQPTPRRRRCGPGCWIVPLATAKPRSWRGTVSRHFDYVNLLQPACQVALPESKFA